MVRGGKEMAASCLYHILHTESDTEENGLASTLEAIAELPPANKDTLAFIILHLQKYVDMLCP